LSPIKREIIRNTLKTHGIRPKSHDLVEKCAGCPWIGFDHLEHVAEMIDSDLIEAFGAS
jgi:hypothetical protein